MPFHATKCLGIALLVGATAVSTDRQAHAQAGDASAATELFREGRDALEAKDYATACAKLEESMRLDAHVGTLISLAGCEEAMGKLARARARWQQAVDLAHNAGDKREGYAVDKLRSIDPRVPRLTLRRGPNAPPTMTARRDDVELGAASFDAPLPVEIGTHTVTASAEGFASSTTSVDLGEGDSKEVVLETGAALPPPPVEAPPPPPNPLTEIPPEAPPRASPLRPIAVAVGGVGVVALGVGTYLGIQVLEAKSQKPGSCTGTGCDPDGTNRTNALKEGDAANIAFASAGVLLVTAGAFWFLAPTTPAKKSTVHVAPRVGLGMMGMALEGEF